MRLFGRILGNYGRVPLIARLNYARPVNEYAVDHALKYVSGSLRLRVLQTQSGCACGAICSCSILALLGRAGTLLPGLFVSNREYVGESRAKEV
jgi:hypothetical protein